MVDPVEVDPVLPPMSPPLVVVLLVEPVLVPVVPVPVVFDVEDETLLLEVVPVPVPEEAPVLPESDGFPLPEELLAREATGMSWTEHPAVDVAAPRAASTGQNLTTASILPIPSAPTPNVQTISKRGAWKLLPGLQPCQLRGVLPMGEEPEVLVGPCPSLVIA